MVHSSLKWGYFKYVNVCNIYCIEATRRKYLEGDALRRMEKKGKASVLKFEIRHDDDTPCRTKEKKGKSTCAIRHR